MINWDFHKSERSFVERDQERILVREYSLQRKNQGTLWEGLCWNEDVAIRMTSYKWPFQREDVLGISGRGNYQCEQMKYGGTMWQETTSVWLAENQHPSFQKVVSKISCNCRLSSSEYLLFWHASSNLGNVFLGIFLLTKTNTAYILFLTAEKKSQKERLYIEPTYKTFFLTWVSL